MPSFTGLPQELRDRIIELAIDIRSTAPKNSETAGHYIAYSELGDLQYRSRIRGTLVMYPSTPCVSACQSLLLVNKSMNSQTRTALDRLNHQFELDVMLVQEYQLWATWLSYVPVFVPNVENVHVSFRILLTTRIGRDGYSGFHGGDGGPPGICWQLYALLEHSLRFGPATTHVKQDRGFRAIQILDLDVITPTDITEEQYEFRMPHPCAPGQLDTGGKIVHVQRPQNWLEEIRGGINILSGLYREALPLGLILYERVGKIRFKLDGDVQGEMDLAERFSRMRYSTRADDEYPKSRGRWCKRLSDVYEKRKAAGLPCIPISELTKEHE